MHHHRRRVSTRIFANFTVVESRPTRKNNTRLAGGSQPPAQHVLLRRVMDFVVDAARRADRSAPGRDGRHCVRG